MKRERKEKNRMREEEVGAHQKHARYSGTVSCTVLWNTRKS